jgi:hypothetical protein
MCWSRFCGDWAALVVDRASTGGLSYEHLLTGASSLASSPWRMLMDTCGEGMTSPDHWYYKLDGRIHGPFGEGELEDLLGRCGDTAKEVFIRNGLSAEWRPFQKVGVDEAPKSATSSLCDSGTADAERRPSVMSSQRSHSHSVRDVRSSTLMWVSANSGACAVLGLALVLNTYLLWPTYVTERKCLATLEDILNQEDQLLTRATTQDEWREFTSRSKKRIAPFADHFSHSYHSELNQLLLSASSDLAPRVLGPASRQRNRAARQLQWSLDQVEVVLSVY